jgi:hypothetical protein
VCGLDATVSEYSPATNSCESGNGPMGSMEGGEFLDKLSNDQLLKKRLCYMETCSCGSQ